MTLLPLIRLGGGSGLDSTRCVHILKWFLVDCDESRYLKEDKPHGSAGGLYYFRDMIMEDSPV